jgi:hypothetical protein
MSNEFNKQISIHKNFNRNLTPILTTTKITNNNCTKNNKIFIMQTNQSESNHNSIKLNSLNIQNSGLNHQNINKSLVTTLTSKNESLITWF